MASSVSLCVGCGKDLTDCSKTRKKLGDDSKASDRPLESVSYLLGGS